MKYLMQLIIVGVVLWVSTMFFPGYVFIDSTKTLIMATVAYSVTSMFFAILIVGTVISLILSGQFATTIITACFSTVIVSYLSLVAAEAYISGFQIYGIMPRVIIAIITAVATTRVTTDTLS